MKTELYYDIRFLVSGSEHEEDAKIGRYRPTYSGEYYFRFSRTVSLPSLPQRGQMYHLSFDPFLQILFEEDDTSLMVQESGFIEESEHPMPYFIISNESYLGEVIKDSEIEKDLQWRPAVWWKAYAYARRKTFVPIFKRHGWVLNSDNLN
jgi:hypothetical protein